MNTTVQEIAFAFGVNAETVRRWIRTGKLEATMTSNKDGYHITKEAVYAFLDKHPKYRYRVYIAPNRARTLYALKKLKSYAINTFKLTQQMRETVRKFAVLNATNK